MWYRRFKIRGAMHIIFYSLPEYAHFYPELVNILGDVPETENKTSKQTSCLVLTTKYEKMALDRIVGVKRANHMLKSGKSTFMFC